METAPLPTVPGEPIETVRAIPCPFVPQWETIDSTGYLWRWESKPQWFRTPYATLWSAWGFGRSQCVGKVKGWHLIYTTAAHAIREIRGNNV